MSPLLQGPGEERWSPRLTSQGLCLPWGAIRRPLAEGTNVVAQARGQPLGVH